VEKKGNKTLGVAGGGWQNRFMIVRKPGNLFYFKDEDVTQEPSGQVDLTLVVNFSLKKNDDDRPSSSPATAASSAESVRLDLDLADRVLKLRSVPPPPPASDTSIRLQIQDSRRGLPLEGRPAGLEGLCQRSRYSSSLPFRACLTSPGMYFPSAGVIDPDGPGDDDDIEASRHSVNTRRQARLSDVDVRPPPLLSSSLATDHRSPG
jgi:hypothetical protein